jgi:hypothetical protein
MSQWGRPPSRRSPAQPARPRPRHLGSEQDQRLRRHKKGKIRAQRGNGTWSEEDQRLSKRKKAKIRGRAGACGGSRRGGKTRRGVAVNARSGTARRGDGSIPRPLPRAS